MPCKDGGPAKSLLAGFQAFTAPAAQEGTTMGQEGKNIVLEGFAKQFGDTEGVRVFFAPGRVNLIGEHTDYNGGHVFPCALDIGTYAAVRKREDRLLRFCSVNIPKAGITEVAIDDLDKARTGQWADYPKGVVWAFEGRGFKLDQGFDMAIYGDIPNGAGLSSSAALEVVTGFALRALYGFDVTNQDLAFIGQYSENNYNGMNCGIMDQFASAMGKKDHAIFLDTNTMKFEYAPIVLDGMKLLITNTNKKHSLVDSEYNARREQCARALKDLQTRVKVGSLGELSIEEFEAAKDAITDPVCVRRARHAVYENQRTIEAVKALADGNVERFGELMNQSHVSLRDDYETSCPEADILAEEAWKIPGVVGSRITGGGFGGCTVSIVKDEAVDTFVETIGPIYKEKVGYEASFYRLGIGDGPVEL